MQAAHARCEMAARGARQATRMTTPRCAAHNSHIDGTLGGGQTSVLEGADGVVHEHMDVAAMPQRVAMHTHHVSITFSHLHATCNHYMLHATHIGDVPCWCVRAQIDFFCEPEQPHYPGITSRLEL